MLPEVFFNLSGKVIIISGAAGLLGRQYVRALHQAGANVVALDRDEDQLHAHLSDLANDRVLFSRTDITHPDAIQTAMVKTMATFGKIDGLVNNAALNPTFDGDSKAPHTDAFEEFPLELWNQSLSVNLTGMFLLTRAAAPFMLSQKSGSIVNIASTYGLCGPDQRLYQPVDPSQPPRYKPVTYTVTKSAVIGFTKYLATYWGQAGIRVNTLTPGGTYNAHDPEFVKRYSARTPMNRMAEPHEYNGALIFLLSDASSYMTGANLIVDGGWTAW